MRKLAIFCSGYALAVFGAVLVLPKEVLLPLGVLCAALAGVLHLLKRLLPDRGRRRALLCCVGLTAGLLWSQGYDLLFLEPARQLDDKTVVLSGVVAEYPQSTDYGASILIRAKLERGSALALLYGDETYLQLRPGDEVSTVAHCTLATHTYGGEEITYYTAKGIFLTAKSYGELTFCRPECLPLTSVPAVLGHHLKQSIDRVFPEDAAALVKAVVTGNRDSLSDAFTSSLQRTGLAHTVAVSGMHLAYLAGFLALLLGRGSRRSALVSLPVIFLFVLVAGSTPSVVRAAIMIVMLQLAPLLGRERDGFTSLAFALFVLLVHNPFSAASVGLQLSFSAVAGIFLCSGRLQERMLRWMKLEKAGRNLLLRLWNAVVRFVVSVFATTLGALVFTTPLTAFYFGRVSLIAPLSNLLTLWAVSAVFVGGLVTGAVGVFLPTAAAVLAVPVTLISRYLYAVIDWMGAIPLASVPVTNVYYLGWLLFVYGLLVLALLIPGRKCLRAPMTAAAVTLAAAVLFTNLEFHAGAMSVQVLDVGQGQCVLIRSGTYLALVDCGGDSYENAGDIAADCIQELGRSSLDLLVISHYHADHANGIPELMDRIDVKEIALPDVEEESILRRSILERARQGDTRVRFIREDTQLPFGPDAEFTVYAPLGDAQDTNELGLTVLCSAGDYDVLLTGDMGTSVEKKLVAHTWLPDVELMVAGHHGSKYSNSQLLLDTVRPDMAVFSVGADNSYGHPTQEAMDRFLSVGAQLYRTDLNGTVTITAQPDLS